MKYDYDLIVIGGGSAGLTAAEYGAKLGARTAIIESSRIGGDCTWTGCVPSKALRKSAKVAHQICNAGHFGLPAQDLEVDLKPVMDRVRKVSEAIYRDESPESLRAEGVEVVFGEARFMNESTVAVDDQRINGRKFIITTGAKPAVPDIARLDEVFYYSYENIWDMERLPNHLLVVGGGPVGCELSQAFRRLGSEVTLFEKGGRLLNRDDFQASKALENEFVDEGINLVFHTRPSNIRQDENGIHLASNAGEFTGDSILIATGRVPNINGLDLDRAGVKISGQGIWVDDRLRTTQKNIYAAGDCIGGYQFTHYAGLQGAIAARNALLPGGTSGLPDLVPWTTFTDPEIAQVGPTEAQAQERYGDGVRTSIWPMEKVDRAQTDGHTTGFLKIIHKGDGTIVGVSIVGERAGEMIHEWILAIAKKIKVSELASILHVYPAYSMANVRVSAEIYTDRLLEGASGRMIRNLVRFTR